MAQDDETENETGKTSGGGLMSTLPLALFAGAATFGMVWIAAAPDGAAEKPLSCEAEASEPTEELTPEEIEARTAHYIQLEPITVSLGPDAGAKHLKLELVLGTPAGIETLSDVQVLRLRDRFLEQLRMADTSLITEPESLPLLKQTLLQQARVTLGHDNVYSVLITDFLMK